MRPPTMELPRLYAWLDGVLRTDAAIAAVFGARIHRGSLAPPGTATPHLVYFVRSAVDDNCISPRRCAVDTVTFIRGVAEPAQYATALAPGMDAVEAALWDRADTVDGHRFLVVGGTGPVEYDDPPAAGVPRYTHLGRDWMITIFPP